MIKLKVYTCKSCGKETKRRAEDDCRFPEMGNCPKCFHTHSTGIAGLWANITYTEVEEKDD